MKTVGVLVLLAGAVQGKCVWCGVCVFVGAPLVSLATASGFDHSF